MKYHFETLHQIMYDEQVHPWKFVLMLLGFSFGVAGLIVLGMKLCGGNALVLTIIVLVMLVAALIGLLVKMRRNAGGE